MKTAVSVPDDIFRKADALAKSAGRSRSEVYSAALREYVARHADNEVTDALDRLMADLDDSADRVFTGETARRTLDAVEW